MTNTTIEMITLATMTTSTVAQNLP